MTYNTSCCQAPVRYLNCDDCKEQEKDCIYVCTECGAEVPDEEIQEMARREYNSEPEINPDR
jgi:hypothetical protein